MKTLWIKQGFGGMQSPISDAYVPDFKIDGLAQITDVLLKRGA